MKWIGFDEGKCTALLLAHGPAVPGDDEAYTVSGDTNFHFPT